MTAEKKPPRKAAPKKKTPAKKAAATRAKPRQKRERRRPGPPCPACSLEPQDRDALDYEIVAREVSLRELSRRYGLERSVIFRHMNGHLAAELIDHVSEQAAERAADLVARLDSLAVVLEQQVVRLAARLQKADVESRIAEIDERRVARVATSLKQVIELLGRFAGEIRDQQVVVVDPVLARELLAALHEFPEAHERASLVLLEGGGG